MTKDLRVVNVIATIMEDSDTIPMSVRLLTKGEKIHPKEEVEEKIHHQGRGRVEMIVMNEEHPGEARIWKGGTNHQRATQNKDIKLMLVNGYSGSDSDNHSERSYHSDSEYTQDEGVAGLALVTTNS